MHIQPGVERHIKIGKGVMPRYCMIPGDPARAERIAERFSNCREVIRNREFLGFVGEVEGIPMAVCSTGIGGPSTSIVVEELANVGVDTFIRIGSSGGRQERIPPGSLVVIYATHREDGTSQAYLPPAFPAVADLDVTNALIAAGREVRDNVYSGIGTTRDAFYAKNPELVRMLTEKGHIVAAEQEAATLYIVATVRQVRAGTILATDSNVFLPKMSPEELEPIYRQAEGDAISTAIKAIQLLAKIDSSFYLD